MDNLDLICRNIRMDLLRMHARADASHIGSSFSVVEILVSLYFGIMKVYPDDPKNDKRDRLILSKGHAASALYATLYRKGLLSLEWLDTFQMDGGYLAGHPDRLAIPYIEASTGSLGHGLSMGVGMAHALKLNSSKARVFVVMSDGEMQEGSVWEACNSARRLKLHNLVCIVDSNGLQAYEKTGNVLPIENIAKAWRAMGWTVLDVSGHKIDELINGINKCLTDEKHPSLVIAHTVKGKGIKEFEHNIAWHYKSPKSCDLEAYLKELNEK